MAKKNEVDAVEFEATEAPVEVVEVVEATEAPVEVEEVVDLTDFEAAVSEAIATADESTYTVTDAALAGVRQAYTALSGTKARNKAKASLNETLKRGLDNSDLATAQVAMFLTEAGTQAAKAPKAPKAPKDPRQPYVDRLAAITLGLYIAQLDAPEGFDVADAIGAATDEANKAFEEAKAVLATEDRYTENLLIRAALKVASGKNVRSTASAGSGVRRDLGKHITEAFGAVEVGTFLSVAEIRKFNSSEYGEDSPSAGAISNRLQPGSGKPTTIENIKVESRDGRLGAVKVA